MALVLRGLTLLLLLLRQLALHLSFLTVLRRIAILGILQQIGRFMAAYL